MPFCRLKKLKSRFALVAFMPAMNMSLIFEIRFRMASTSACHSARNVGSLSTVATVAAPWRGGLL